MSKAHEVIREFGHGSLDDRLTAAINEVSAAVLLTEKPGAVTLKLAFSQKAGMVVIGTTITTAPPKQKHEQMFYVSPDGELSRRDPNQPQLPTMEEENR